jgi:hypothetical protein
MGDSMSTIINATTTNGVVIQPDNSGSLVLQTNSGTTALTIDTSQRAAFVAGTAALPAITTTGDTNTGVFFPAADTIAFAEGGAEAMRIDSSGNVGIGTTSTGSTRLNVFASDTGDLTILSLGTTGAGGQGIRLGVNTTNSVTTIKNNTSASYGMAFYSSDGTSESMRIDSSGRVGINTTSPTARLHINSDADSITPARFNVTTTGAASKNCVIFQREGTNVGFITVTNAATAYATSSDYRLKENIVPMTGALATVTQLKPVTYKWKIDGSDGQGFIAHELQAVVPDAVVGEKDAIDTEGNPEYQGVDTSFLVATLTAAIQEQQTIINDLKARVETLEAK